MRKEEMLDLSFPGYKLASFCRETNYKGGVCILARNDMIYQPIGLNKLCKEKTFEISAVKFNICSTKVILCCVYRSPSENPNYFLKHLEKTQTFISAKCLLCNLWRPNYKLSDRKYSEAKTRNINENL
jgi:hypothetical protein